MATSPTTGSTLAFGPTLVGTTNNGGPGQNVTVQNTGGGTLNGSFGGVGNGFNPAGAQAFSLAANATDNRTYNFAPATRGAAADVLSITSDGGNATLNLTGQGVAPVADVNTAAANAGNVRIGTSGTASIGINNIGDGNLSGLGAVSNLNGSLGAASGAPFSGAGGAINLADGAGTTFNYGFAPTSRGIQTELVALSLTNGNPSGNNSSYSANLTLAGTGVGPEYQSMVAPGGTIDFGPVSALGTMMLTITNNTPDGDLGALTDLTLLSLTLTGDPGFSVPGFAPMVVPAGGMVTLNIEFDAFAAVGMNPHTAMLTVLTDQGAALGAAGQSFSYQLTAVVVPEPVTATMLLFGAAALMRRRRA